MTNSSTVGDSITLGPCYSRDVARCPTCHRRLAAEQACPVHGGCIGGGLRIREDGIAAEAWPVAEIAGSRLITRIGAGGFASVWSLEDGRVVKLAHASHDLARARLARE